MTALGRTLVLFLAVGSSLGVAHAAETTRDLAEQVIPPDLVLAHAEALRLDPQQRGAVQRLLSELHPRMPPLMRRMREERDALVELLKQDKPDEAAVLARFDALTRVETELKRLRLQMTVGVKKVLTGEQQAQAIALQDKRAADAGTLPAKLKRVKEGLEQWKREGRDVAPLRERWERFREAEDKGFYRQAQKALDEAIALLDASPPAARP